MEIGDKFGRWTVLKTEGGPTGYAFCRCSCGIEKWVSKSSLRLGKSRSCGNHQPPQRKDHGIKPGDKIGYWTVLREVIKDRKYLYYVCRCQCGTERAIPVRMLLTGRSLSCGCHRNDNMSDGQKAGQAKGIKILDKIHTAGLAPAYPSRANKNNRLGVRGVCLKNGKYLAVIMVDRRQIYLGSYDNIADATAARKVAEEKYFKPRAEMAKKIIEDNK